MHDKYKKNRRAPRADERVRRQIALEAARRLIAGRSDEGSDWLGSLPEADLYAAKRKAAAVLGRPVRPGDLPSDSEVRQEAIALLRSGEVGVDTLEEVEPEEVGRMADHLDPFTFYRLRLLPLESVKQSPLKHPEGDALYHSLQVFEIAREARPYDEDFLLAALLHDVGKAIDASDHVKAGVEALRGAVSDRTYWLIEHHHDLDEGQRPRRSLEPAPYLEDLQLLRECNLAGRVPGRPVEGLEPSLEYIRGLENEEYLEV
jgi:HD domain